MDDIRQVPGRAQTIKTRKATLLLPPQPVKCACGCGTYFEDEMYYYVRVGDDGTYVRSQVCADKVFRKDTGYTRQMLNKWLREGERNESACSV